MKYKFKLVLDTKKIDIVYFLYQIYLLKRYNHFNIIIKVNFIYKYLYFEEIELMNILHLSQKYNSNKKVKSLIEKRELNYKLKNLYNLELYSQYSYSYDLIILEIDKYDYKTCLKIYCIQDSAFRDVPIILLYSKSNFLVNDVFDNLNIIGILDKNNFFERKFEGFLDSIIKEKYVLESFSSMSIAVIDDTASSLSNIESIFKNNNIYTFYSFTDINSFYKIDKIYELYIIRQTFKTDIADLVFKIKNDAPNSIIFLLIDFQIPLATSYFLSIGIDEFISTSFDFTLFMQKLYSCVVKNQWANKINLINKELYELATRDLLTGVYNRTFFIDEYEKKELEAKKNNLSFSIILFDLDYFKNINDEYGHQKGDLVLKTVAKVISNRLRKTDVLSRWGGEEFCILLFNTDIDTAEKIAEELRFLIENIKIQGIRKFTASFGVTQWKLGDNKESLFKRVDNSLYLAKLSGRNKVVTNNKLYPNQIGSPINIEWGPFFRSGNNEIDSEHKTLIQMSNNIIIECFKEENYLIIVDMFNILINHILQHFINEELILETYKYSQLKEHKEIHKELTNNTLKIQERLVKGDCSPINVAKYIIQDVVVGHIIKSDFDFFYIFDN